MKEEKIFQWTKFYPELANKLLGYKEDRKSLLRLLQEVFKKTDMQFPFTHNGELLEDICPFTIFGCFNKGIKDENRIQLLNLLGRALGVSQEVPTSFEGIPRMNNMKAWFFGDIKERKEDIPNLWTLFEVAIEYADLPTENLKMRFIKCYDRVIKQPCVKWNLSMGLYWIRPYAYINLDRCNRDFITQEGNELEPLNYLFADYIRTVPDGKTYLEIVDQFKNLFRNDRELYSDFPHLSHKAWEYSANSKEKSNHIMQEKKVNQEKQRRYWIYAPGENSCKWDEFYTEGIMAIGWDALGNLVEYKTREAMRIRMKEIWDNNKSYTNASLATWQFVNEMAVGDIIYVKQGRTIILGRGIVESDYIFDDERKEYKYVRQVRWTHKGVWEHPGQAVMKTLTDISPYVDYREKIEAMITQNEDNFEAVEEPEIQYNSYTEGDFLNEVFMDEKQYETLVGLLKYKKNLILQGAPGVGKTFAAKRLAYSIMGAKDTSRVMMVQFHQSYSYEDFIMGYRPTQDGFELMQGPFYQFCKRAQDDSERDYFFIIDEINRGNLSKIFGELLMLIEKDKRGDKLRLLYANELFSVPSNVHIIGMMNTADRSLAMIDYALRRRFAFYELEPAFDSEGFNKVREEVGHPKFGVLVDTIKALNQDISKDEALGTGFRIGHSYLCTDDPITDEWIEAVIKYELLPLIYEYWFDDSTQVEKWQIRLSDILND